MAKLKKARPELLSDWKVGQGEPIPEEAPPGFFEKTVHNIEGIGEPTSACFFTLTDVDPTNW